MRPLPVFALSIIMAISCSHGSNTGITVRIEPSVVTIRPGESLPFAASVSGTTNLAVYWSVDEGDEGGTVASNGVYTAPVRFGVFHVTAASRADPTKTATASVNVTDASVAGANDAGPITDSATQEPIGPTTIPDAPPTPGDTAPVTPVDPSAPIPLIGPLPLTHANSPDPLPLYPPDDKMPDSKELNDKINIVTSRASGADVVAGVAPLYVFFDASKTLKAADGDVDLQATYIWSFDTTKVDPNTRYNRVSGFLAGHVFNLPGKYIVRLDVFDKDRQHGYKEIIINVAPFAGATFFVSSKSSSADDNNAGTRERPFKTAQRALREVKNPNTRILFHGGDTFDLSETQLKGPGPVIISSYGDDPNQPPAEMPTLRHANGNSWWVFLMGGTDFRIVGLRFTGLGTTKGTGTATPGGINMAGKDSLISRCEFTNMGSALGMGGEGSFAIYENDVHNIGMYGIYGTDALARISIIGNYIHDWNSEQEEHGFRMQKGSSYFIGFNVIEANDTKSCVQIRGDSDHIVLYGNVLDRASGINPQNGTSGPVELEHHVVVDSNVFIGRTDSRYANGYPVSQEALHIAAKDVVVRNNLVYNYDAAFLLKDNRPNIDRTERVWFENNTVVSSRAGMVFSIQDDALSVSMVNNVLYSTATTTSQYDAFITLYNTPFDASSQSNNNLIFGKAWPKDMRFIIQPTAVLSAWQSSSKQDVDTKSVDPVITTILPTDKDFAVPNANGPVGDTGAKTGNWADARGRLRGSVPDLGAFEVKF